MPLFTPAEQGRVSVSENWLLARDGDPIALALYERHYSCHRYRDGRTRRLFVGPGEKIVLLTPEGDALFVWRRFVSGDGQEGVNCAVFRNESALQSSALIVEAMLVAWDRWPGVRLYTYVNSREIRSSNPGYCFLCAGWVPCGITKWNRLTILETPPEIWLF